MKGVALFLLLLSAALPAQVTNLTIDPALLTAPAGRNFSSGVFFVPKTVPAYSDFMNNGLYQQAVRTNVIESALNNASNLGQCISVLQSVQSDLVALSQRTDRLIFIFEKMPPWLSSSTNSNPAQTLGWSVLNTKPPANWNMWATVVDSIVRVIVNQMNIPNAWFEIWNEPDIGSWTGSMNDYWKLYRTTYDAVKSAVPTAPVGGPAVNGWANNIGWQAPFGYVNAANGNATLIGQLLDSSAVWNKVPDFISWHSFGVNRFEFGNACTFIQQKCVQLGIALPELIVSEWNAPSTIRDTPLAAAYAAVVPMMLQATPVACNVFAAWQDFSNSTVEFHHDYGLLSYGAIHKPVYYSLLATRMLDGSMCMLSASEQCFAQASASADSVQLLISNYSPPPFVEALLTALYTGLSNVQQLDSMGYINIATNDFSRLDSIFRGLLSVNGTSLIEYGIVQGTQVYAHFNAYQSAPRTFQFTVNGLTGVAPCVVYLVDSTHNNMQTLYDSLISAGYTQSNAINFVTAVQGFHSYADVVTNGTAQITLQPNAVCMIRIYMPGISGIAETKTEFSVYPNPARDFIVLHSPCTNDHPDVLITDFSGNVAAQKTVQDGRVSTADLAAGMYVLSYSCSGKMHAVKFVKAD